jgi:tRNA dimethylallyltransferase
VKPARPAATVVVITGPTAAGKTDAALALAERLPVDLISMDSAMVYRGMDIGTAKPSPAMLARYPHALVDIRDPAEPYSAADFVADADAAVRRALARDRLPVLVGGTMLYLRAFREGLADLPPADPEIRAAIAAEGERLGWPALYVELSRVDPSAAAKIHPHNRVRIQRALEVFRATGRPLSAWWSEQGSAGVGARLGVRLLEVAIVPASRTVLVEPIARRFAAMLEAGLIEEVAGLKSRGDLSPALPSMRAVGYRQVWAYLDGAYGLETLHERGAGATRSLAKRQFTWLNRWSHVQRLAPGPAQGQAAQIAAQLELSAP